MIGSSSSSLSTEIDTDLTVRAFVGASVVVNASNMVLPTTDPGRTVISTVLRLDVLKRLFEKSANASSEEDDNEGVSKVSDLLRRWNGSRKQPNKLWEAP